MSCSFLLCETTIGQINDMTYYSVGVCLYQCRFDLLGQILSILCPCSFASAAVVEACPFGTRPASGHCTSKAAIKSHGFVIASYILLLALQQPSGALRTETMPLQA